MEWLLFFFYLLIFIYIIKKSRFFSSAASFRLLSSLFILKIACGCCVAFLYRYYYGGGDTFTYMHDANIFYTALRQSPADYIQLLSSQDGSAGVNEYISKLQGNAGTGYAQYFNNYLFYVKLLSVLCIFSFGNYYITLLLLNFLSLWGLTALYKVFRDKSNNSLLTCSVFFIPSVIFWGSALLKEPFILFLTGCMFYSFSRLNSSGTLMIVTVFALSFIMMLVLKFFIAAVLIPGFAAWYIYKRTKKHLIATAVSAYLAAFAASLLMRLSGENYDIYNLLHLQQIVFMKNAVFYKANSLIELIPFAPQPISVLKRFPEALYTAFCRPWFFEAKSLLQYLAAAENVLLLVYLSYIIYKLRSSGISKLNRSPACIVAIISGTLILAVTAFTTPVLGTLVRLKIPGLLLLLGGMSGIVNAAGVQPSDKTQ